MPDHSSTAKVDLLNVEPEVGKHFVLNNIFTFRDRRLKGRRFVVGLATFAAISAVGAVLNINIAAVLFGPAHWSWYLAGIAGAVMSLVWNYAVSSAVTWRR